jgi:hypothetical protein
VLEVGECPEVVKNEHGHYFAVGHFVLSVSAFCTVTEGGLAVFFNVMRKFFAKFVYSTENLLITISFL